MNSIYDLLTQPNIDEIVSENVALFESLNPGVIESESDYYMPAIRSFSEREMRLRAEMVFNLAQMFWMDAEGDFLDHCAKEFEVYRLEGSKPTANFIFSLSSILDIDITIPTNTLLLSDDQTRAYLIDEVVIPAGEVSAVGRCELDMYIETTDIKTETIGTPLPYILEAQQLGTYSGGLGRETDEALRARIPLSLYTLSGAGPIGAYKKLTFAADSRIKDVYVYENNSQVQIIVDTLVFDSVMEDRILSSCSEYTVRPLSDKIEIYQAEVVPFEIQAKLTLKNSLDISTLSSARVNCAAVLGNMKIGESLSIARIIDALFIPGVLDVELLTPTTNISTVSTQVARLISVEVTI